MLSDIDPKTGQERPVRCERFHEWGPELQAILAQHPRRDMSCIETDDAGNVMRCFGMPATMAREWIEKGKEVFGASALKTIYEPKKEASAELLLTLVKQNEELKQRLDVLETTKKGGR
jgi:hypothetical protein